MSEIEDLALSDSRKLLRKIQKDNKKIHVSTTAIVAAGVKKLKTVGKGKFYRLTKDSKEQLKELLNTQGAVLKNLVKELDELSVAKGVAANAGRYGKATEKILARYTDLNKKILAQVTEKINLDLVNVSLL
ncbi:hypothetical protein KAR91_37600, partial [Candidatus Pacearchaeota archaeon]|nr:hypothetical protein [Candidatus Pacearchaeota archaeon]